MKPRIVLAGGTGFIGEHLSPFLLAENYDVVVLTRAEGEQHRAPRQAHWDGKTPGDWVELVNGAAAIVNLTGRNINCRHTPENRRDIIDSRIHSVRVIGEAIKQCTEPPKVFVQLAAVGIYGDKGERICDEMTPPGDGFVAKVCEKWEASFAAVDVPRTRKVLLRAGVVLGPRGGFLGILGSLTRWFLGGQVGKGTQYISWIHITDLLRMVRAGIEREEVTGILNATAPNPLTNAEFMRALRRALHRPWSPPVPKLAARVASYLMGTEASLALVSQRCIPKRFLEQDFDFEYPNLRAALANIYPAG